MFPPQFPCKRLRKSLVEVRLFSGTSSWTGLGPDDEEREPITERSQRGDSAYNNVHLKKLFFVRDSVILTGPPPLDGLLSFWWKKTKTKKSVIEFGIYSRNITWEVWEEIVYTVQKCSQTYHFLIPGLSTAALINPGFINLTLTINLRTFFKNTVFYYCCWIQQPTRSSQTEVLHPFHWRPRL